jgi:3-hydroxybutyrate dehydrogenase
MSAIRNLEGKRALITGSTQGIGLAVAQALAARGAHILLHGLASPEEAGRARAAMLEAGAASVVAYAHDLSEPSGVESLLQHACEEGAIDILVNNAGIQHTAPLADMPRAKWDAILAVNLSACFDTMRILMPRMARRGYGRVVNIASVHGLIGSVHKSAYVAAKFGLVGLSRVAALEFAKEGSRESGGVTVNCICPGWTETAILEPQIHARATSLGASKEDAVRDLLREKQPTLRMSLPGEIGSLAAWLCDPAAHNVTGTAIPVDGGWTAQ